MTLLLNESPVFVQPSLVRRLGLLEAAIVQQLHYWSERATRTHDGHVYVYKTYQEWSDEIGVSAKAVRGAMDRLRRDAVVVGIQNPTDPRDRTLWWRIDHAVLESGAPSAPEGSSPPPRGDRPSAPRGSSNARASGGRTSTTSENTAQRAREAITYRGRRVPADVADAATAAVTSWAQRTGQTLRPFTARGRPTESLTRVIGAMLDFPEVVGLWPAMIDRALAAPWWSDDAPGVGVVFGPNVRERMIEQAKRPAMPAASAPNVHPISRGASKFERAQAGLAAAYERAVAEEAGHAAV